jgi:hypothetical protein
MLSAISLFPKTFYPDFVGHEWALLFEVQLSGPAVRRLPAEQEEDDAECDAHVDLGPML